MEVQTHHSDLTTHPVRHVTEDKHSNHSSREGDTGQRRAVVVLRDSVSIDALQHCMKDFDDQRAGRVIWSYDTHVCSLKEAYFSIFNSQVWLDVELTISNNTVGITYSHFNPWSVHLQSTSRAKALRTI